MWWVSGQRVTPDAACAAGILIEWPIVENADCKEALELAEGGESPNNVSAIIKNSLQDGATFIWLGDLETEFMEKIAGTDNCRNGDCPTVYRTDRGTIAIQGERLAHPTPDHEAIVEIPLDLLTEAVRALGG